MSVKKLFSGDSNLNQTDCCLRSTLVRSYRLIKFQRKNEICHFRDTDFLLRPKSSFRRVHSGEFPHFTSAFKYSKSPLFLYFINFTYFNISVHRVHRLCESDEFAKRHETASQGSVRRTSLGGKHKGTVSSNLLARTRQNVNLCPSH